MPVSKRLLGIFQYSHEENTSAYQMPDDVPADIKTERASYIMDYNKKHILRTKPSKNR